MEYREKIFLCCFMYLKNMVVNTKYEILKWDTEFFRFSVAKILPKKLDLTDLEKILKELKEKNVKLVYWATNNKDKDSQKHAKKLDGFLTGKKISYVKDLTKNKKIQEKESIKIEKYTEKIPNSDLLNLIIQGGVHSRFYVDPKISKKKYEELHKLWICNSVKDNMIFVAKKKDKIIGFVSLNEKNNIGNIDFIVVDKKFRGSGIATNLMNHSHNCLRSEGYSLVQADTQQENINACNMYRKLGYYAEKKENIYHFWL